MKDLKGNARSVIACNGASQPMEDERQTNDYYATEPKAIELLLQLEKFNKNIWECACGGGHLSKVLVEKGFNVTSTDLIYRNYGIGGVDIFKQSEVFNGDIITNPPYKYAREFVEKSLELVPNGNKVAMFLKLTFLESQKRKKLFETQPPKTIYVSSSRLQCAKNGDFKKYDKGVGMAIAYAWFIWEKGYTGETVVKWFN